MKFSKEFNDWYKDECDTYNSNQCLMTERVYRAFKAHDEELNRLRKFEKKVRKLQDKCNRYIEKSRYYYLSNPDKSIDYEMKYDEALEEFLYL
jgi:uncharacterized protein YneR